MIAGSNAIGRAGHGGFALDVGDTEDGETAVVFGAEGETDDVEVGSFESAADVEVDGGVGVVEADAIIQKRVCPEQADGGDAGAFFKPRHSFSKKIGHG